MAIVVLLLLVLLVGWIDWRLFRHIVDWEGGR